MGVERQRERERYARDLASKAPPGMVAEATAARLAGDWRGACRAAQVDVQLDLGQVTRRFGAAEAARIEADLAGFAPDYLRLHLRYDDELALWPHGQVLLSRRPEPFARPGRIRHQATPVLLVTLPSSGTVAQRLTLRVADLDTLAGTWDDLPAWAWHADAVADRRWAYGASESRLPWHPAAGAGDSPSPADRAGEFERLLAPVPLEQIGDVFRSGGVDTGQRAARLHVSYGLRRLQPMLPLLAAEARRLAHRYGAVLPRTNGRLSFGLPEYFTVLTVTATGALVLATQRPDHSGPGPAGIAVSAPLDAALLRWGTLTPEQLHPLVQEALFPGRPAQWQPALPDPYTNVLVRCGKDWHTVEVAGASLLTPHHDDAEVRRQLLVERLGGRPNGCTAALKAFRTGKKPIPKDVRRARQRIVARAFHGDTEAVLTDLGAGTDPLLRFPDGRTFMHLLAHVDHRRVLPLLLRAGFALEDRDRHGQTPLHAAALSNAEPVMAALIEAGADRRAVDADGLTAAALLARARAI